MIVRDSARTLPACLASISPWVDELIIVDTGSTDKTRQISRQHGARVFEFPWCDDFAAARNESLWHANGDWLFWMDSDDVIDEANGRKLRALADGPLETAPEAYVMQVHCPGPPGSSDMTAVDHVKMFRNRKELRFEGRIHEQILPAIRRIGGEIRWTDVFVVHAGAEHSAEARRRKQERDLRLLEMELADHPDHPFVLFNLGMTYADMEQADQAAAFLQRCLDVSPPEESHVRKAYALLVGCLTQLNEEQKAREVAERGLTSYPDDPELLFRLGVIEQRSENYEAAIRAYHGAIADAGERRFSSRDRGITGHKARHNLAGVYRDANQLGLAELQWRLALEDEPGYREGWLGLAESLLEQKKYVTLEVELDEAERRGHKPLIDVICARARLAAARGDVEQAFAILDSASLPDDDDGHALLRVKCQLLFENGSSDEAISALEELCRRQPADGAAWHNLGTAHQRAGHAALAAMSYQRSLAFRPDAAHTLVQLGYAHHELGRKQAANLAWQAAGKIAPGDPKLQEALAKLGAAEPVFS